MKRRRRKAPVVLPLTMIELALASWETIARRTVLMSSGACTPAEYRRMVQEKVTALHQTALLLTRSRKPPDARLLLGPWHRKATANARRLRRR